MTVDYRRDELIKIQVIGALAIGLLVSLIVAPWSAILEGRMIAFLVSILYVSFAVYTGLCLLLLISVIVDGYSRTLSDAYHKERWTEVGALLGAPTGAIAAVVWVYNHSSTNEYLAFFFGGGLAGLFSGTVVAAAIAKLVIRR